MAQMANDLARTDDGMRQFNNELMRLEDEFAKALPTQMQGSKFVRCIMTAVQRDPKLLKCDRKSLWAAAMQAAHDGLYPDGRYGIILPYPKNLAKKGEPPNWISLAQWQPMILGVYQKLHNSGKLASIVAHVVYEHDLFDFRQGDDEAIYHTPKIFSDRGKPIGVYAIAKTTNSGVYREVMSVDDVERVRSFSKSKDSPAWRDHWDEMAKAKVVRRLAKRLPLSADDMGWLGFDDEGELSLPTPVSGAEREHMRKLSEYAKNTNGYGESPTVTVRPAVTDDDVHIAWDAVRVAADKRAEEMNEHANVEPPPPEEAT